MSAPAVDLTPAERDEILAIEREIGRLYQRQQDIRRAALRRDGVADEWIRAHA